MLSNPLFLFLSSFLSTHSPPRPLLLSLPHLSTPQALLESALKHWSRVKRYVAQDGSGQGQFRESRSQTSPGGQSLEPSPLPSLLDTLSFPVKWCNRTFIYKYIYIFFFWKWVGHFCFQGEGSVPQLLKSVQSVSKRNELL